VADDSDDKKPKRRLPPLPTAENLDAAALAYLERFDSTAQNLKRVLVRKVLRAARAHDTDPEEGKAIVQQLIVRYRSSGLVSDVRYASSMARGLRERGGSVRGIRQKLRGRGVSAEDAERAMADVGVDSGEGELEAARVFARKRRLGPFRTSGGRAENMRRDMAAMARAGFGFDVCRKVLGTEADELSDGDP